MQPTPEQVKELIDSLNRQHPNPYTPGQAYPATNPFTGQEVRIRRSQSVRTGEPFLHIYTPCDIVIRDPQGNELSRHRGSRHYRANLRTHEIREI